MLYVAFFSRERKGFAGKRREERIFLHLTSKLMCATEYLDPENISGKKHCGQ